MDDMRAPRAPLHLWIVGIVALLWNSFGALDFTMTHLDSAAYLAPFTAEQRAYFTSFPWHAEAAWAAGVWGALIGSALLLLRRRHAVTAFALSLAGLVGTTLWQHFHPMPGPAPAGSGFMTLLIWIIAVALLAYAWMMRGRGVLR